MKRLKNPVAAVAMLSAIAMLAGCSSADESRQPGSDAGASDTSAPSDAQTEGSVDGTTADGCTSKTCLKVGAGCGIVDDGCGGTLDCGTCAAPDICGGAGVENQCGCTVKSCSQLGANCGDVDTGCGIVSCGDCSSPNTCGGGGVDNQCGCSCSLPNAQTTCTAGSCQIEACETGWADCDGNDANGCETHVEDEVDNCGVCGNVCSFPNAIDVKCTGGSCAMGGCASGFADCDSVEDNGCEANLGADPTNCNSCGNVCPPSGGTPVCVLGQCAVSTCSPGLGDCSATQPGCETDLLTSTSHCGFCGNACDFPQASPTCEQGLCQLGSCDAGHGNCDGNDANGCETNTASNTLHCGSCLNACKPAAHATTSCVLGNCAYACLLPWIDCDGSDGCEINGSTDVTNCGGCGQSCSTNNVINLSCNTGACVGDCLHGYADCNNNLRGDGCETNTNSDPANCGGCGLVCSSNHLESTTCKYGACGGTCSSGWGDCNNNKLVDGCEANLLTDKNNCGTCGHGCGDCAGCSNGVCVSLPCE